MRRLVLVLGLLSVTVLPAWAWDVYGPTYGGSGNSLQLRTEISNLERQIRDLRRDVDRLQGSQAVGTPNSSYPLPGQSVHGFRPVRDGAYEMSLNGTVLRIARNGDLSIQAAGKLHLEGETVITNAREQARTGASP